MPDITLTGLMRHFVGACCRNLFHGTASLDGIDSDGLSAAHRRTWYSEYNVCRATMLYSLIASVLIVAGLPRPGLPGARGLGARLLRRAGHLFPEPLLLPDDHPRQDRVFHPSAFARWFGGISLVVFTAMSLVLIFWQIWVPLFGS